MTTQAEDEKAVRQAFMREAIAKLAARGLASDSESFNVRFMSIVADATVEALKAYDGLLRKHQLEAQGIEP